MMELVTRGWKCMRDREVFGRGGHWDLFLRTPVFCPGPDIVYLLVHEQERYSGTMDVTEILKNKKSID